MIYFDNAATTYPKPPQLLRAMTEYLHFYTANPGRSGHEMAMQTAQQVYQARQTVAEFFHARNAENIIFTQNCTHSLNIALKGLLGWGDHVVISDLEHNSVLRPVHKLWMKNGVQYSVAQVAEGDDDATVANFRALLRPETKLIACTHGSNAFGIKLPLARLAALAHENGSLLLADCAQTAGTEELDVQKMGIDFLAAPGHKGLYGPTGTGVLVVNCEVQPDSLTEGGTGSNSLLYEQPDFLPDALESGTVNTLGILALEAGISDIRRKGIATIRQHEMELIQQLYDGISSFPDVRLYTKRPTPQHHLPVLSFTLGGQSAEQTAAGLNSYGVATRGGYHCAPLAHQKMGTLKTGTVRLSLGMYNTMAEVQEFLAIINLLRNRSL